MIVSKLLALSQALAGDESEWESIEPGHSELDVFSCLSISADASRVCELSLVYLLKEIYGSAAKGLRSDFSRLSNLCGRFLQLYGDGPVSLLRAPARINVLGEHVDYVSYLPTSSLTFGSREKDMLMLYRCTGSQRVRGASTSLNYSPNSFDFDQLPAPYKQETTDDSWLSFLFQTGSPAPDWLNYVRGAVNFARLKFTERVRSGFDFLVDSSIPAGGGASSSSALVVLAGAAIRQANGITYTAEELARDSAKAEWYVGTRGGSMDHTTICLALKAHAVFISYASELTRRVPLPGKRFQWLTFFSKPADKGREVMIEYNERAAVSRLLIPAVIDSWKEKQPDLFSAWHDAVESFSRGDIQALEQIEVLISHLPLVISLEEMESDYLETLASCARSFPALVNAKDRWPLQLRSRALHHLFEIKRVALATAILDSLTQDSTDGENEAAMQSLGQLLNESHQSLRDLYGVSNADVEELTRIIRSDANVYGARLMGGGFGGNVLALTRHEHAPTLIERVQSKYYEPRQRRGMAEGSIMISTPGDGLANLSLRSVWRSAIEEFSFANEKNVSASRAILALLDALSTQLGPDDIWPIIVAAGKGTRATTSGMETTKPLAQIGDTPAILHVLRNVLAGLSKIKPPVVIVSPENESEVRRALEGENVTYAIQPKALGTGDAVLSAYDQMRAFQGTVLVVWSTQPVIRPVTFRRAATLAKLFRDFDMILPTTLRERPYAPLQRDDAGRVRSASETHLESANALDFGETNIGLFILKSQTMFKVLHDLKQKYWDEASGRYTTTGHELGFPNELVNYLAQWDSGVFASPIADPREEQGIKTLDDVARCRQFILELRR